MPEATTEARFPIGKFEPQPYSEELRIKFINELKVLPDTLERTIQSFDEHQFDTPYREGGWTVRQLVHHIADSHMNAYIRFKLALTEDNPTIKTYDEKLWAQTNDVFKVPVNVSVTLLHALHRRWVALVETLTEQDLQRTVYHPDHKKELAIWFFLSLYAWHCRHHVAHINKLKEQKGW